jgi:Fe-S cluster assembly protein SufD
MKQTIMIDQPGIKEIEMIFDKENEDRELVVVIRGETKGVYDLRVVSDHRVGKNRGRIKIKGIAANGAMVKVNGLVKIAKEAQEVDDFLEMRLLIMDEESMAVAEPKLEIEANQVKASHAATVGMVDRDQLFYLMSRGLDMKEAKKMMVDGFLK